MHNLDDFRVKIKEPLPEDQEKQPLLFPEKYLSQVGLYVIVGDPTHIIYFAKQIAHYEYRKSEKHKFIANSNRKPNWYRTDLLQCACETISGTMIGNTMHMIANGLD